MKKMGVLLLLCGLLLFLVACTNEPEETVDTVETVPVPEPAPEPVVENDEDEEVTIKVMYRSAPEFSMDYGNLFVNESPHVTVDVVSTTEEIAPGFFGTVQDLDQLIEDEQPDVLVLSPNKFEELVEAGKVASLEHLIQRDEYDIEGIYPAVIDEVRQRGGGEIYGLTPNFMSNALLYNADLFDQYNIPHPEDSMSLEEVLQLAQRFPADGTNDDRIYGLYYGGTIDPANLLSQFYITNRIRDYDAENRRMLTDTEEYKHAWEIIKQAINSGAIFQRAHEEHFTENDLPGDWFAEGRAAMTIGQYSYVDSLQSKIDQNEVSEFDWQLVTAPVNTENRNQMSSFYIRDIFAINASSDYQEEAWELVKFINGESIARIKANLTGVMMGVPARTEFVTEKYGRNMEAYYKLEPRAAVSNQAGAARVSPEVNREIYELTGRELNAYVQGEKTIDEALLALEQEGQALLDQNVIVDEE